MESSKDVKSNDSGLKSSPDVAEREKPTSLEQAATSEAFQNVASSVGGFFGGGAIAAMASKQASGGSNDIKFDEAGVKEMITYLEKAKEVELAKASESADRVRRLRNPGHPVGDTYTEAAHKFAEGYLEYHGKLEKGLGETIANLKKVAAAFAAGEDEKAASFKADI